MDYTMAGMEDILGSMGNLKIRDKWVDSFLMIQELDRCIQLALI